MSEILQSVSDARLLAAMEANFAEEMATFGRYLPNAELHEDPELQWFITGIPGFNGVLRTSITGDIDAKIKQVIRYFQERQAPLSWVVGPTAEPGNLGTYLKAHGFTHVHDSTGMAADLQALNEDEPALAGFLIEEITSEEMLKSWLEVTIKGFGSSASGAQVYYDTYLLAGFGRFQPWHHYLGRLNNVPVAISSLLLHAGVAGIYGVATIPEARRSGIGAAMTLAPLREARSQGYHVGVLSPSQMGIRVYRRLGFQEYCKMSFYNLSF